MSGRTLNTHTSDKSHSVSNEGPRELGSAVLPLAASICPGKSTRCLLLFFRLGSVLSVSDLLSFQVLYFSVSDLFFPYPVFFHFKSLFRFGPVLSVSGLLPFQVSFPFRICSFRIRSSSVLNRFLSVSDLFFPYQVFFRFESLSFRFGPVLSVSRSSSVSNLFFPFGSVLSVYPASFRLK